MSTSRLVQRCTLTVSLFHQKQLQHIIKHQRCYSHLPLSYDGEDPGPIFFQKPVQDIMLYLIRPDPNVIFKKRTYVIEKHLETPQYKYMTDEELQLEMENSRAKAKQLLMVPPVVKVYKEVEKILYNDPALIGFTKSKYVFTDITYGLSEKERFVIVREPDGRLKHAEYEIKKRMCQTYFPLKGREIKDPTMFVDDSLLNNLLDKKEYLFVLDRACIQYNPEEYKFQSINAKTFQHIEANADYNLLRSTRHFGSMSFYYAWNNIIDGLMQDLLDNGVVREATALITLQRSIHPKMVENDESKEITKKIMSNWKILDDRNIDKFSNAEVELDEQCFNCINNYIQKNSTRKAKQELALQNAYVMYTKQLDLERNIRKAHGII